MGLRVLLGPALHPKPYGAAVGISTPRSGFRAHHMTFGAIMQKDFCVADERALWAQSLELQELSSRGLRALEFRGFLGLAQLISA